MKCEPEGVDRSTWVGRNSSTEHRMIVFSTVLEITAQGRFIVPSELISRSYHNVRLTHVINEMWTRRRRPLWSILCNDSTHWDSVVTGCRSRVVTWVRSIDAQSATVVNPCDRLRWQDGMDAAYKSGMVWGGAAVRILGRRKPGVHTSMWPITRVCTLPWSKRRVVGGCYPNSCHGTGHRGMYLFKI